MTPEFHSEAKLPYVVFEVRALEDRAASLETGRYMTRDVDFAIITPHGSKDRIDMEYKPWVDMLDVEASSGRFPAQSVQQIKAKYKAWKEGLDIPVYGTPIVNWAVASPAQKKNLIQMGVTTVEALAETNEDVINGLGMGGRALKQQAQNFLKAQEKGGAQEIAAALTKMQDRFAQLEADNAKLREQNTNLQAALPVARRPASGETPQSFQGTRDDERGDGISKSDLGIGESTDIRKL